MTEFSKNTITQNMMNDNSIPIIFVEGGIGCGKSTLVKQIQDHCKTNNLKIYTIQEPVDIWVQIIDENTGKNMIEAFYSDQEKYSFEFQMMAYISRLQRLQETIQKAHDNKFDIVICERSLQTDKNVFCKMLYDEGKIGSYGFQIYNKWFDYFQNYLNNSYFVYLQTDFNICYERVLKRKRNGENVIEKSYLQKNNAYHDNWLLHEDEKKVLILNGNIDCEMDSSIFDEHIQKIFEKFVN